MSDQSDAILFEMRALSKPENIAGMARFGINTSNAYGISMEVLRSIARRIGKDHALAGELWAASVHEGRILAALIDDPRLVTETQMEAWAADFDSWDLCDQCCSNLFDRTPWSYAVASKWAGREEEYVKRAAFSLMAALASHDKRAVDEAFLAFLPIIQREAGDERNFVKKAVNWALRGIGKRNLRLNQVAIATAEELRSQPSRSARWIAADTLRELRSEAVQERLAVHSGSRAPS